MDLAEITNSRPRTRSMDSAEGTSLPADKSSKKDKSEKKKKKKRKAEGESAAAATGADDGTSPKKSKKLKKVDGTPAAEPGTVAADTAAKASSKLTAEAFCAEHKILVKSEDENFSCPVPMTTFDSTPFGGPIRGALKSAGYPAPTPTQAQSWPIALSGRDIISVARTGSGKTLGFLLPAFHALLKTAGGGKPKRDPGPYIVVLAPTRELACQINDEATKFGSSSGILSTTVYGESIVYLRLASSFLASLMIAYRGLPPHVIVPSWDRKLVQSGQSERRRRNRLVASALRLTKVEYYVFPKHYPTVCVSGGLSPVARVFLGLVLLQCRVH